MQLLRNFEIYIVDPAIMLVFAAGLLLFMYGMVEFILKLREGSDTRQGVQHMIWGVVGMFIMISVQGIINIVINFIGADPTQPDVSNINIPKLPFN